MTYLERAITDGHAKLTGDPNNDIQPVSREALNHAIKKCHQTLWADKFFDMPGGNYMLAEAGIITKLSGRSLIK